MPQLVRLIFALAFAVLLGGCASPSRIDTGKFAPPKSVVIGDFPDILPAATIRSMADWVAGFYFTSYYDATYVIKDDIGTSLVAPRTRTVQANATGGLIGELIYANAAETERKAVEFPKLVNERNNADLRTGLLAALTKSLEAKGVQVRVADDTRNEVPRPRWTYKAGERTVTGAHPDSAPFDADLYVQLAPISLYVASGPLNNYTARIGLCVLVYDARTRQYLGSQLFRYEGQAPEFSTYEGLVAAVDRVAPLLQSGLLTLVPQAVETIAGKRP